MVIYGLLVLLQPGTGQLVSLVIYGLLVLLLLAMSNGLYWFPLRDVMLGQRPLFVIIWIFTRIRVVINLFSCLELCCEYQLFQTPLNRVLCVYDFNTRLGGVTKLVSEQD